MRWLLLDLAIILIAVVALALTGLQLWRKIRTVRTTAAELKTRAVALSEQTAELSARLDSTDVLARAGQRAG